MTARLKVLAQVLIAGGLTMVGAAAAYAQDPETACDHRFSKGSGLASISYCVNADANIVSFNAGGYEHLAFDTIIDGYALCSSEGVLGYDFGATESPWGENVQLSAPTTSGVKYGRTTADGRFRIEHTFKLDAVEHDVTVTVKVVNIGSTAMQNVYYKRLSDFDAGHMANNLWTRSFDGVGAQDLLYGGEGFGTGISLNASTFTTAHRTGIGSPNLSSPCTVPLTSSGSGGQLSGATGDYAAHLGYELGTLAANGGSKTVKFVYKRK